MEDKKINLTMREQCKIDEIIQKLDLFKDIYAEKVELHINILDEAKHFLEKIKNKKPQG